MMSDYVPIRAPRGQTISCKGWQQEAAMRMLMNNLDEEVAENPRKLVVYGGSLAGRILLTGGLGGMGGAQPLAATMAGAAFLGIDVDPARVQRRIETGYLDKTAGNLDEAWKLVTQARDQHRPLSVGLVGN